MTHSMKSNSKICFQPVLTGRQVGAEQIQTIIATRAALGLSMGHCAMIACRAPHYGSVCGIMPCSSMGHRAMGYRALKHHAMTDCVSKRRLGYGALYCHVQ